jgi:hypothetical protein
MDLLRGIDQQKEKRERAGDYRRHIEREFSGFVQQRIEIACFFRLSSSRLAGTPKVVDGVIRRVAFESLDDVSQPCSETPHVVVKGDVLGTGVRISRH